MFYVKGCYHVYCVDVLNVLTSGLMTFYDISLSLTYPSLTLISCNISIAQTVRDISVEIWSRRCRKGYIHGRDSIYGVQSSAVQYCTEES